jgi:hypothetical protein
MEKKHLSYSDNLLVRVVKSQEKKLKALKKPADEQEAEEQKSMIEFYKECLGEAKARGLVKVPEKKLEEPKKDVGQ